MGKGLLGAALALIPLLSPDVRQMLWSKILAPLLDHLSENFRAFLSERRRQRLAAERRVEQSVALERHDVHGQSQRKR